MKREDVYKLIDGEREYQDSKWSEFFGKERPESDADHSIADWVIYMEKQLALAKEAVYMLDYSGAMACIRKVTALGIAAMEFNETPPRK